MKFFAALLALFCFLGACSAATSTFTINVRQTCTGADLTAITVVSGACGPIALGNVSVIGTVSTTNTNSSTLNLYAGTACTAPAINSTTVYNGQCVGPVSATVGGSNINAFVLVSWTLPANTTTTTTTTTTSSTTGSSTTTSGAASVVAGSLFILAAAVFAL